MHSPEGIKAMVLAAGVGSRLDPLTKLLPKPLVPFVNRPVMEYALLLLKRHGITDVISNVHYLPEMVPAYFGNGSEFGMNLQYTHEPVLSGDAGGVRACRSFLESGTFVVLMGDLVTDVDLSYIINQHKERGAVATIALKQVEDVERFGVAVVDKDGLIKGFQEKPSRDQAKSNLASTGIYVLEPEIFQHFAATGTIGFGKDVFPKLIDNGLPVLGVECWGYWSDVGTIPQLRASTFDALQGLIDIDLPGELGEFGWVGHGSTIGNAMVDGVIVLGQNSHIADGVTMRGYAVIGDNCVIERGAHIEDSIVWSGTVVGNNVRLKNAVVGSNCYVQSGTKLYEQAIVEPQISLDRELMQKRVNDARRRDADRQQSFGFAGAMDLAEQADRLDETL